MGLGPGVQGGGVGWIARHVAPLDESLNEGEALAQGGYCDVSAIFAGLPRECGDQVVGDECQLGVRVFCRKVSQLLEASVAQTSGIAQERHARQDGRRKLLARLPMRAWLPPTKSLCAARQLTQLRLDELDDFALACSVRLPDRCTPCLDHFVSGRSGGHAQDVGGRHVSSAYWQIEARPVLTPAREQRVHALNLSTRPVPLDVEIQAD